MSDVKLLSEDYDLSKESDIELVETMRSTADIHSNCYHGISSATCDAWDCVVRVAVEIAERAGYSCIPADFLEQEINEKTRKVSTEDMDDAFLIDTLRDRGYMLHVSVSPKVAHFEV